MKSKLSPKILKIQYSFIYRVGIKKIILRGVTKKPPPDFSGRGFRSFN